MTRFLSKATPFIRAVILLMATTAAVAEQSHSLHRWIPDSENTHRLNSPTPTPTHNPLIHASTYVLPVSTATDAESDSSRPPPTRRNRWLPWLIAGGVVLLLAGLAAQGTSGGGADASFGESPSDGVESDTGGATTDGGTDGGTDGVGTTGTGSGTGGAEPPPLDTPTVPGQTTDGSARSTATQDRLEQFRPQHGVFFSLGTSHLNKRATEQTQAAESGTEFLSLGYDRLFRDDLNAGLLLDLSRSDITVTDSRGSRNNRANALFAFADYQIRSSTRFSAYLGVAAANNDNVRFTDGQDAQLIDVDAGMGGAGLTEVGQINSDSRINETLLGLSIAQPLTSQRSLQTELRLNVDYARKKFNGYREAGNTSLELIYPERLQDSLTARLGFGLTRAISTQRGVLVPQFGLDWVHESRDQSQRIVATLASDPASRSVSNTDAPDSGYGSVNAGLSLVAPRGFQLYVAYEKLFQHDYRETDTLSIGARLEL